MLNNSSRYRWSRLVVLACLLATPLAGCETFDQANKAMRTTNNEETANLATLNNYQEASYDTVHDTPYLLGAEIAKPVVTDGSDNPIFNERFTVDTSKPMTLDQLASLITQQTGVAVNVTSQVDSFLSGNGAPAAPMPPLPGQTGVVNAPQFAGVSESQNQLNLSWNGPLRGLLNLVASRSGTFWKFENGTVIFYLTDTKAFDIDALPGVATLSSSISDAGTNGGTSGGSSTGGTATSNGSTSQSAGVSASLDIYTSIQNSINTILAETQSAGGSGTNLNVPTSVAVNQAAGQIIVTATPPELAAVQNFITPLNRDLAKNVLIDLHVYSVQLNDSNNYGLNLSAAFQSLTSRYGISFSSVQAPTLSTGGGTLSAAILSAPTAGQGGLTTPTSGVIQALATQGDVSLVTNGSVIALNGQPTPLQVAQNKGYLASSSTTTTVNAGTSTSLTPGSYTVGFSGTFLPLVRGQNVLLEYNINLTQDLGLQTLSAGGSEIQLPQIADQSFMQRVSLQSGQTLVLSGFEQDTDDITNNGTGAANFFLLGGGRSATHGKQALVVVIHVENLGT